MKTRMHLPRLRLSAVLILAVLALGGCGQGGQGGAPKVVKPVAAREGVTLRVGVQKDGIRSILERSGALQGAPYKVEYSVFAFGPPLVEAAGADKIDVASVGSTPPIFGAAAQSQFRVVGTQEFDNRKDDTLLVRGDSPIRRPEELKGKSIAVAKGSSAHGLLLTVLRRVGLKQSDLKISFLAPADGLAAFSSGRVDAWAVWEPFVSQGKAAGGRGIAGGPPDEHGLQFTIASTEAVKDQARSAAVADYLRRLRTGFRWAKKNPEEWAAAWSKESGLPESVTRAAVPGRLLAVRPVSSADVANQQRLADVLSQEKVIPKPVRFEDIVTRGLLDESAAN